MPKPRCLYCDARSVKDHMCAKHLPPTVVLTTQEADALHRWCKNRPYPNDSDYDTLLVVMEKLARGGR